MAVDRFPVEYSHIMMFARSVGDPNPIYHDPEAAKA
ncbi:MAG: N-terminal half of MaoC dehydratase, partial [Pseudomonadota bacterium]